MTKAKKKKQVRKATPHNRVAAPAVVVGHSQEALQRLRPEYVIWHGKVEKCLKKLPSDVLFDLVITSPPYNIGKEYEERMPLKDYLSWQKSIIKKIVPRISPTGSLCWQVGNYVDNGYIVPLDIALAPIFEKEGLKLRNRIVWQFGHGLHNKKRFSGRYEVILWYTKSDEYRFNLDDIRIPSKYPGKRHHKGPRAGELSGNPLGKNPEDVWSIPNVKSNHIEKTDHPCQFPVGLIERLILGLSNPYDLVFDPFAGVSTTGAAAALHKRRYIGCEPNEDYVRIGRRRINLALKGKLKYRPHNKPIYDHTQSKLSEIPKEWKQSRRVKK
jgi:adenine-specific DNA-methyltransferase